MLVVCALFFALTFDFTDGAALWPRIIIAIFAAFALLVIAAGIGKTRRARSGGEVEYPGEEEPLGRTTLNFPLQTLGIVVGYGLLLSLVGFFPSTVIFLVGYMYYGRVRDWRVYVGVVVGLNLAIYLLFVLQLSVQLPSGIFFE